MPGSVRTFRSPRRRLPEDWDETAYLSAYPDVARAVEKGTFASGHAHFQRHGRGEGRHVHLAPPADWDESTYLHTYPDVAEAVGQGGLPSGYAHYCRHGRQEVRVAAWTRSPRLPVKGTRPQRGWPALAAWFRTWTRSRTRPAPDSPCVPLLPRWLDEEMRTLAVLDPGLTAACAGPVTPRPPADPWAEVAYRACWRTVQTARPTHILLVPALRAGGADRALELALQAILEVPGNRPLVITTDALDNPWGPRLPQGCTWLSFPAGPADEARLEVLVRLLLNAGAGTLHVFYSQLGWEALRSHAPALAQRLRIFVSIYCVPPAATGLGAGYARHLGPLLPHLAGILTDNRRAAERLEQLFGVPQGGVTVLRHPIAARNRFAGPGDGSNLVLWAGRLDRDKRPDLLRDVLSNASAIDIKKQATADGMETMKHMTAC